MGLPGHDLFNYLVRFKFEIKGSLQDLVAVESIEKWAETIPISESLREKLKESNTLAWIEHRKEEVPNVTTGHMLIRIRADMQSATLISEIVGNIKSIRSFQTSFTLLEIEDLQSNSSKTPPATREIDIREDHHGEY